MTVEFGRPFNPFARRNPVATPSRSLGGSTIWFPQLHVYATQAFTTTNTANYLYAFSGNIQTFGTKFTTLQIMANVRLHHSVNPAQVDVRVFMDLGNATGNGYYVLLADNQILDSTSLDRTVSIVGTIDLDTFTMVPGLHTIGVAVKNFTTGTLTMPAPTSADRENYIHTVELPWKALS